MGRGGFTRAEFIDGIQKTRRRGNDRRPEIPRQQPSHIDLRVIRPVLTSTLSDREELNLSRFFNTLAAQNHAIGTAIPLGGIAITQFSAKRMTEGLREAYPNDFFDAKKKPKLYRKAKRDIDYFIREQKSVNERKRCEELAAANEIRKGYYDESLADGAEIYLDIDDDFDPDVEVFRHPFGQAKLDIKDIDSYGRKYGFDLTLDKDDILREEFNELYGYIGKSVLGGVQSQHGNPRFHATIFKIHDHVGYPELKLGNLHVPDSMLFDAPQTELHIVESLN